MFAKLFTKEVDLWWNPYPEIWTLSRHKRIAFIKSSFFFYAVKWTSLYRDLRDIMLSGTDISKLIIVRVISRQTVHPMVSYNLTPKQHGYPYSTTKLSANAVKTFENIKSERSEDLPSTYDIIANKSYTKTKKIFIRLKKAKSPTQLETDFGRRSRDIPLHDVILPTHSSP